MNTNKLILLALAIVTALGWASAKAAASMACTPDGGTILAQGPRGQGGPPPGPPGEHRPGPDRLLARLNLTEAQKEQIRSIHESARAAAEPYHDQLEAIHDELKTATANGKFDEATVRAIAAKAAQVEIELTVIDVRTRTAVYNVLTPEQKAKLAELEAELEKRHDGPRPPHD